MPVRPRPEAPLLRSIPASRTKGYKNMMSSSPKRGSFQTDALRRRLANGETTQEHVNDMIELHAQWRQQQLAREQDPQWQDNNLEYDLRSSQHLISKVRASEVYAQHLYAALCNRTFQKKSVWPLLKGQHWSCSWRYAGGIVADMRGQGDYIDWYCTGIRGDGDASHEVYDRFVGEGTVTDEVHKDLLDLGWIVLDSSDE